MAPEAAVSIVILRVGNHLTMYRLILFCWLTLPALATYGQATLSLEESLAWALKNHPVAEIARAVELQGPAALLRAQGAFDPKIAGAYDRKQFLGTEYFDFGKAEIEWQSPYAVKFFGGYEFARGVYLNDERFVPVGGQPYLGLKLPLLQGLVTDAARIDRQRGDVAVERQRALAEVIRNELRYDLAHRYAEWLFTERALQINIDTEVLLETYLRDTRSLFEQGDKPAVDTLEAFIYLGTQRLATRQARVDAQVAKLAFSEMYWPLEEEDLPESLNDAVLNLPVLNDWEATQPELRELQLLVTDYQLQQRLKREKLKPKLEGSYYLLGDGARFPAGSASDEVGGFFDRAYKIGFSASYPLLNRKARGDLQLGQLKIVEGENKLADKRQALQQKAVAYRGALQNYREQLTQAIDLTGQNRRLLEAERELFRLGESTQFLLNIRQQNLQKAMLVSEKLRFSRNKAAITWRYLVANWQ